MQFLLVILLVFTWHDQACSFTWDDFNVQRLFWNSDEVFNQLKVEPDQTVCVEEVKFFVNSLKNHSDWALRGKRVKSQEIGFLFVGFL